MPGDLGAYEDQSHCHFDQPGKAAFITMFPSRKSQEVMGDTGHYEEMHSPGLKRRPSTGAAVSGFWTAATSMRSMNSCSGKVTALVHYSLRGTTQNHRVFVSTPFSVSHLRRFPSVKGKQVNSQGNTLSSL
jgi:hypothetical protein